MSTYIVNRLQDQFSFNIVSNDPYFTHDIKCFYVVQPYSGSQRISYLISALNHYVFVNIFVVCMILYRISLIRVISNLLKSDPDVCMYIAYYTSYIIRLKSSLVTSSVKERHALLIDHSLRIKVHVCNR